MFPGVREKQIQPQIMFVIDNKEKTLNIALMEPTEGSSKVAQEYRAFQVKVRLDHINVANKIELHKRIGEIIFLDLLQYTISNDKLQENWEKMEHQLKQENIVNKAWQVHIKEYKKKIVDLGDDPNNSEPIKSLLKEKEN